MTDWVDKLKVLVREVGFPVVVALILLFDTNAVLRELVRKVDEVAVILKENGNGRVVHER